MPAMNKQLITKSMKVSNEILLGTVVEFINEGRQVKMNISGSSMQPFLFDGDTVLLKAIQWKDIKLGDIILGKYNGLYVLHRVINKKIDCVHLAGDNNTHQIEVIYSKNIYALATSLIKPMGNVDLTTCSSRYKGLCWYYLRPFRIVWNKLFKN